MKTTKAKEIAKEIDHYAQIQTIYKNVALALGYCRCAVISNKLGKTVKLDQIDTTLASILLTIDDSKTPDEAIRNIS